MRSPRSRSASPPRIHFPLPCLLAAVVWLCASAGLAQPSAATPTGGEGAAYTKSIEGALEEYRLGHYEEARSLFERAHALEPSARTLRGLGMVEFELRHYVRASQLLEQSLASTTKPLSAEQRSAVEELLARTLQFVVRYTLEITPAAAQPQISIDGATSERDPHGRIALVAGEHELRVTADGYQPFALKLDAQGAEQPRVRVNLTPLTSRAALETATSAPPVATRPHRKLGIALTTAGSVLVAASAAAWFAAWSKAKNSPTRDSDDADTARVIGLSGDIGVGIGLASAVTGVVLLLHRREQRKLSGPRIESLAPQLRVRF